MVRLDGGDPQQPKALKPCCASCLHHLQDKSVFGAALYLRNVSFDFAAPRIGGRLPRPRMWVSVADEQVWTKTTEQHTTVGRTSLDENHGNDGRHWVKVCAPIRFQLGRRDVEEFEKNASNAWRRTLSVGLDLRDTTVAQAVCSLEEWNRDAPVELLFCCNPQEGERWTYRFNRDAMDLELVGVVGSVSKKTRHEALDRANRRRVRQECSFSLNFRAPSLVDACVRVLRRHLIERESETRPWLEARCPTDLCQRVFALPQGLLFVGRRDDSRNESWTTPTSLLLCES